MRVFVAGATGAVGRPLVRRLLERGHEVWGTTRRHERARELDALGAHGVVCDALDAGAVRAAVADARPEAVVQQLTDLPQALDPRALTRAYAANDRVRRDGTRNLHDAALAAGAQVLVAQSIAFAYRPEGDWVKSEDAPLWVDAEPPFDASVAAVEAMEGLVTGGEGLRGVVLRYGYLYGPGTWYSRDGAVGRMVRARRYPIVGGGGGVWSWLHVEDAAGAAVAAIESAAAGIFNVCDDHPAPVREWLPTLAEALGAKPPRRVPAWVARLAAGRIAARASTIARGASNARARRELGWTPELPDWREGFRTAL